MKQQFVETIKMKNGEVLNLTYHQKRLERTIAHFFPELNSTAIPRLETLIDFPAYKGVFKIRVLYGNKGIEHIECAPYTLRSIRSLQVVHNDEINYAYKSTQRTALQALAAQRGECDDIVIVKNGLVTDTSFTNLAIFNGHEWLTPRIPLLAGTRRAWLLDKGMIKEADLTPHDLYNARKIRLFNAMIDFDECELNNEDCLLLNE